MSYILYKWFKKINHSIIFIAKFKNRTKKTILKQLSDFLLPQPLQNPYTFSRKNTTKNNKKGCRVVPWPTFAITTHMPASIHISTYSPTTNLCIFQTLVMPTVDSQKFTLFP